ncbi:hypothetical protein ACIREE_27535 [Streptomyces sp. NPDC102467]|uniref:hypothetical protein n=1 Tax=Streptomyces sp. NPDC102467 TaxID=3366179 RepID=UPI00382C6452
MTQPDDTKTTSDPECDGRLGRRQAVARLLALDGRGKLTTERARLIARSLQVSLRTV